MTSPSRQTVFETILPRACKTTILHPQFSILVPPPVAAVCDRRAPPVQNIRHLRHPLSHRACGAIAPAYQSDRSHPSYAGGARLWQSPAAALTPAQSPFASPLAIATTPPVAAVCDRRAPTASWTAPAKRSDDGAFASHTRPRISRTRRLQTIAPPKKLKTQHSKLKTKLPTSAPSGPTPSRVPRLWTLDFGLPPHPARLPRRSAAVAEPSRSAYSRPKPSRITIRVRPESPDFGL